MRNAAINPAEFGSLVPIKALTPEQILDLLKQSEVCSYSRGQVLFQENDPLDKIVYVIKGEVGLLVGDKPVKKVIGGTQMAKLPLAQGKVSQQTARALTDLTCVKVDPDTLDIMLTWDQKGGYEVQEIDTADSSDEDWMSRLLQAKVFSKIPPSNIQLVFMRMETHHFEAGETVIRQGEDGDQFFIIREGKCQVTRKTRKNPEGMVLATLGPGDNFGEESLISGGKRNASIIMLTKGVLMSLSKSDFLELLNDPVLSWVNYSDACSLAGNGAIWIDVRLPAEYQERHIVKSVNIPLPLLRAKVDKLDPKLKYLVYCDSGRRSSIAAYLLSQNGREAVILQDSLETIPATDME